MTSDIKLVRQKINQGIAAHKAGDTSAAWLAFQAVVREEPTNTVALLWLAYIAPDNTKRIFLLERVLQIDPTNQRAQEGLAWTKQQIARAEALSARMAGQSNQETVPVARVATTVESTPQEESAAEAETVSVSRLEPQDFDAGLVGVRRKLGTDELKEQAKKGTIAQRARRRINPLIVLLITGSVLLGILVWGLLWLDSPVSLAALAFTATATETATATPAPTATPTATFTPSPVPPTATPTPLPPTETPTPVVPTPTPVPPAPPTPTPLPQAYQPAYPAEKWIEVDLSDQRVIAWEGSVPVMSFLASTGLPGTPTIEGQFRIYQKLVSTRMIGPGYDLPDVPYTMYFYAGFALHGAYWHNNFGQPMSHGCVNLSNADAQSLFYWALPVVPDGVFAINATDDNPGTVVIVHQ